jgi:nucleotide-binding universal stress UspA family protein
LLNLDISGESSSGGTPVALTHIAPKEITTMRILLATDGSAYSEAAVNELASRPMPIDSQVLVISVVELPSFPWAFPGGGVDFDQQMQQTGRAAVEEAVGRLKAGPESQKMNITSKVVSGSPKRVILEEADAYGAELIMIGSHGRGAWDRLLLGSVSQAVAAHAKCSVEIVRKPRE